MDVGEMGESSSSVVEAVESNVRVWCRVGYGWLSLACSKILAGSPCMGCVTMGTGGGTLEIGRGVGKSNEETGLVGIDEIVESV